MNARCRIGRTRSRSTSPSDIRTKVAQGQKVQVQIGRTRSRSISPNFKSRRAEIVENKFLEIVDNAESVRRDSLMPDVNARKPVPGFVRLVDTGSRMERQINKPRDEQVKPHRLHNGNSKPESKSGKGMFNFGAAKSLFSKVRISSTRSKFDTHH